VTPPDAPSGSGRAGVVDAPAVVARGVWKAFGPVVAVEGLSLTVLPHEIVASVGVTGAGKSTALRLVMGSTEPDRGEIRVLGHDPVREFSALRGRIAPVFQTDRLLPWRTALENAALGLEILGVRPEERTERTREWLVRLGLGNAMDRLPHELSGGMRQRVSLARAFALNPEVLLLDEAFSHLDEVTATSVRSDFLALVRPLGIAALLVTHSVSEAVEVADRILIFGRPAHVRAEIPITPEVREDPAERDRVRRQILALIETATPLPKDG
jgi:NitT/TauT family transport system ATP-binding protein